MAKFEFDKTKMVNESPKLAQTRCISCGAKFLFFEGGLYKPKTCANFDCVCSYLHNSQHFQIPYNN